MTLTSGTGRAISDTMLAGAAHVPEIAELRQRFIDDRIRRAAPIVHRAVDRGNCRRAPGRTR